MPCVPRCSVTCSSIWQSLWRYHGDRWVSVSIRTFCSFPYFYLYFSSSVKSQYAAQIKPLSLKCGDYQYFDVASLNEERYGEEYSNYYWQLVVLKNLKFQVKFVYSNLGNLDKWFKVTEVICIKFDLWSWLKYTKRFANPWILKIA